MSKRFVKIDFPIHRVSKLCFIWLAKKDNFMFKVTNSSLFGQFSITLC